MCLVSFVSLGGGQYPKFRVLPDTVGFRVQGSRFFFRVSKQRICGRIEDKSHSGFLVRGGQSFLFISLSPTPRMIFAYVKICFADLSLNVNAGPQTLNSKPYFWRQGDLVNRLTMGITRFTIWVL